MRERKQSEGRFQYGVLGGKGFTAIRHDAPQEI